MASTVNISDQQMMVGALNRLPQSVRLRDKYEGQEKTFTKYVPVRRNAKDATVMQKNHIPDRGMVDPATGLRRFKLPDVLEPRVKACKFVKEESPWLSYDKIYDLRLGVADRVTVAEKKDLSCRLVNVSSIQGHDAKEQVQIIQRIKHRNFVSLLEVFKSEESFYAIFEHVHISINYFAGICYYPNELQLASILGQIIRGLSYLVSEGLEHGSLSTSNIFINPEGELKIANQERCHVPVLGRSGVGDIRALSYITMELMQKYVKANRAVGVDDLRRWPSDSYAVLFLSETTSASSLNELAKHPLLGLQWRKEKLKCMVSLVQVRGYDHPLN